MAIEKAPVDIRAIAMIEIDFNNFNISNYIIIILT
jgi:hypothetical protein